MSCFKTHLSQQACRTQKSTSGRVVLVRSECKHSSESPGCVKRKAPFLTAMPWDARWYISGVYVAECGANTWRKSGGKHLQDIVATKKKQNTHVAIQRCDNKKKQKRRPEASREEQKNTKSGLATPRDGVIA